MLRGFEIYTQPRISVLLPTSYCLDPSFVTSVTRKWQFLRGKIFEQHLGKGVKTLSLHGQVLFIFQPSHPKWYLWISTQRLSPLQIGHIEKAHLEICRVFSQSSSEHLDRPWGSNGTGSHTSAASSVQHDRKCLRHSQIAQTQDSNQQVIQPSCCCLLAPCPKTYPTDGWLPYRGWRTCLHELHIGACATEYAKHFRTSQLQGPEVAYFMLT